MRRSDSRDFGVLAARTEYDTPEGRRGKGGRGGERGERKEGGGYLKCRRWGSGVRNGMGEKEHWKRTEQSRHVNREIMPRILVEVLSSERNHTAGTALSWVGGASGLSQEQEAIRWGFEYSCLVCTVRISEVMSS